MAGTFDTSRVGGGTYELEQDSTGNYKLKSVGFDKISKLNLPDLKTSDTTDVAETAKKAAEETVKKQTTEVFKPTNVYQSSGNDRGQEYANMPTVKEATVKEATVRQAGDTINTGKTDDPRGYLASGAAGGASLQGDKASSPFLVSGAAGGASLPSKTTDATYKSPTMAMKEKEFAQSPYTKKLTGLQKVTSKATDTIGNVIDSVKNNKAIQVASNVLGFVTNPIIGGAKLVAGMLPKDSASDKFNRSYFNSLPPEQGGRIAGNPAKNVFAGKNAVSMFGDLSGSAEKRINTRLATANKNKDKWSKERLDKFNNTTKDFQKQKSDYDKAKEKKTSSRREEARMNQKGAGGNDSGRAGGGRVICTELHRTKELSTKDWIRDTKFTFKTLSKTHVKGYLLWAEPTVKHIQKYPRYRKIWKHIAQHRANDIAWRLNEGKFDLLGRIYAGIGEPVCWILGNFVSDKQISKYNLTHWRRA